MTDCDRSSGVSKNYTRQSATQEASTKHVCFFCGDEDKVHTLHEAATFGLNKKVSKFATDLQDQQLLAKLSAGDLIAQDAGYLVSLYNRAVAEQAQKSKQNTIDNLSKNIALAELLT